ncbi:MAG: ATP-binding protein [bacterium]
MTALNDGSRPHPIRCWEWLRCDRVECKAYRSSDLRCWLAPHASCHDGSVEVAPRLISECGSCPVYSANRERAQGKRGSDWAMLDTVDALVTESVAKAVRLGRVEAESRSKSAQVTLLSEVGRALQRSMDIDRILLVILTAATAGAGLGFNRAFLLLVDEADSTIRGRMAVGPSHAGEAAQIWQAMEREARSLSDMLTLSPGETRERRGIMAVADRLVFSLSPDDNVVARSLEQHASFVVDRAGDVPDASALASILGSDQFLVVPLVAEGKKLGAIVADNFITGRKMLPEDVRLLETFASQAALAILNASLHKRLQDRVKELEDAHQELTRNHLQLLRAERMVAAGGLAGALIHDLKAPIVSIGLMARAAASGLAQAGPLRDTLDQISQEIIRIEEYLKKFAKSAGTGTSKTENLDMARLVDDCLSTVRGLIDRNRIKVVANLGHGEARVRANRVELRQVMVNLLHNAVEAMPDGGTVTVTSAVEGGVLRVSVEDTGKGISDEDRARVFSPFFTTKAEGSGLGLVIARRIVTGYGGRITLDSKEGVGTCFSIFLPISK